MADAPAWLPPLLLLSDHDGDWEQYVTAAYAQFHRDFIATTPRHDGLAVVCRRDPICDGKHAGFWHCTSEGRDEQSRTPDLRRLERTGWTRAIVEHSADLRVSTWFNQHKADRRKVLWYAEEFVVIIAARPWGSRTPKYRQLITAYCTFEEHRKRKFRAERDASPEG